MNLPNRPFIMSDHLFNEFEKISSKEWKHQIQYELKGTDYNETMLWESLEGIKVKPFYHTDLDSKTVAITVQTDPFKAVQLIYVKNIEKSLENINKSLDSGADALRLVIADENLAIEPLFAGINATEITLYIELEFLSESFIKKINDTATAYSFTIFIITDPIHQLAREGNWFKDLQSDFSILNQLTHSYKNIQSISINGQLYQNAGANSIQQIAYIAAHANEYLNRVSHFTETLLIQVAVGSSYFFEIDKIRALRLLLETLVKEYHPDLKIQILATPTKRNKTIYTAQMNRLRTTTECMSALLGGADAIENSSYDSLFRKANATSDQMARNELSILKNECHLDKVNNPIDGAYYLESITAQFAEKALILLKDIEKNGGFITQLIEGTIQRKIREHADKEQKMFDTGKDVLWGSNKNVPTNEQLLNEVKLYPFVKIQARKTLIKPIIEKRLAENLEKERLEEEKKSAANNSEA